MLTDIADLRTSGMDARARPRADGLDSLIDALRMTRRAAAAHQPLARLEELQRRCLEQLEAGLDTVHPVSTSTSQLLEELRWIMDLQNADGAQEQILQWEARLAVNTDAVQQQLQHATAASCKEVQVWSRIGPSASAKTKAAADHFVATKSKVLEQTQTQKFTSLREQTDLPTCRDPIAQSVQLLTDCGLLHTSTTVAEIRRLLRSISARTAAAAAAAAAAVPETVVKGATSPPEPTARSPLRHNGKEEGDPTLVPRPVPMDEERTRQQDSPRADAGRELWLWRLVWILMRGALMASGVAATQHYYPLLRQWLETRSDDARAGPRHGWRTARGVVAAAASRGVQRCTRLRHWVLRRAASVVGGVCNVGASIRDVGNAARGVSVRYAKKCALGARHAVMLSWHAVMLLRRMVRRRTMQAAKAWWAAMRRSRRPKQDAVDRSQHDDAVVVDVAFGVTNRLCPRTFCLPPTADAEVGCREEQLTAEAITTTYQILA